MNAENLRYTIKLGYNKLNAHRRILATAGSSVIVNAVRAVVSLVTIPIILHGYGEPGLAIWLLLLSLIGLLAYFSAGVSSATITAIGSISLDQRAEVAKQIIAAFLLSVIMAGFYLLISFLLFSVLDAYSLLNIGNVLERAEFEEMITILAVSIAIVQVLSVPKFALIGLGQGYKGFAGEAAGCILSCVAIAGLAMWRFELKWLVAAFIIIPALTTGIAGLLALWPRLSHGRGQLAGAVAELVDLGREALRLAMVQASFALSTHSDITLISIFADPLAGIGYGIAQRLFAAPLLCLQAMNMALWPEISRAHASGNGKWIRAVAARSSQAGALISVAAAVVLVLLYEPITHLWLGEKAVKADFRLVLGMAFWLVLTGYNAMQGTILRAVKETKLLFRSMVVMSILNIFLSIVLIKQMGAAGAIWGTAIAILICLIIPFNLKIRALWKNMA